MMRGRVVLLLAFGSFMLVEAAVAVAHFLAGDSEGLVDSAVRVPLTVLLMWLVYRGYSWARILTVVLVALGAAIVVWRALSAKSLLLGVTAAYLLAFLYVMALCPSVDSFLLAKKTARRGRCGTQQSVQADGPASGGPAA
jgi:hypothetical protein